MQPSTEEEVAERKKRIAEVSAEVEKGNLEKAGELAARCTEDYRGKDLYGEAFCGYLVGHSIICQYLKNIAPVDYVKAKIPSSDYDRAKSHLKRSSEIFDTLAKNRKMQRNRRLMCATVLIDMAMLESLAQRWDEAMKTCRRSLDIHRKYKSKEGIQIATRMMLNLTKKRIGFIIKEWAGR